MLAFCVRRHLFEIIGTTLQEHYDGYLCLDGLWINQKEVMEEKYQVALMGDVYQGAAVALLSLHMQGSWSHDMGNFFCRCKIWGMGCDVFNGDKAGSEAGERNERLRRRQRVKIMFHGTANTSAFLRCNSECWIRLWIVREIVLAKSLTLHYGDLPKEQSLCMGWSLSFCLPLLLIMTTLNRFLLRA